MSASDLAIKREIIRKELKCVQARVPSLPESVLSQEQRHVRRLAAAHPYSEERLAAERTLRVQDSITGPIVGVRYVGLTVRSPARVGSAGSGATRCGSATVGGAEV